MSQFEFLMMVASVIVAVGIAEILGSWGRLLRADRGTVRFDWLHIGMTIALLLSMLQYWIGMWAYHPLQLQTTVQVLFLMLPSFFLVISAYVISPAPAASDELDCRSFYLARRFAIWIPLGTGSVLSAFADAVIAGMERVPATFIAQFAGFTALLVVLAINRRIWAQGLALALMMFLQLQFYAQTLEWIGLRFVD